MLIRTARAALDDAKLSSVLITAGIGVSSTREMIQLAHNAAEASPDFIIVIPPEYYTDYLKTNMVAVKKFFIRVANTSPLPTSVHVSTLSNDVQVTIDEYH